MVTRATQPDKMRDTAIYVPLTSLESITGQGVKRATGMDGGWCLAAPSLRNLVSHDGLYIPQPVAAVTGNQPSASTRPKSVSPTRQAAADRMSGARHN